MKTWGQTTARRSSWQEWTASTALLIFPVVVWMSLKEKQFCWEFKGIEKDKKEKNCTDYFTTSTQNKKTPSCLSICPTAASVHRWAPRASHLAASAGTGTRKGQATAGPSQATVCELVTRDAEGHWRQQLGARPGRVRTVQWATPTVAHRPHPQPGKQSKTQNMLCSGGDP